MACHTTQTFDCLKMLNMLNRKSRILPAIHAWQAELACISEPLHKARFQGGQHGLLQM